MRGRVTRVSRPRIVRRLGVETREAGPTAAVVVEMGVAAVRREHRKSTHRSRWSRPSPGPGFGNLLC